MYSDYLHAVPVLEPLGQTLVCLPLDPAGPNMQRAY